MNRIPLGAGVKGTADHNTDAAPAKLNLHSLHAMLKGLAAEVRTRNVPGRDLEVGAGLA
jgi:hypothetical protein